MTKTAVNVNCEDCENCPFCQGVGQEMTEPVINHIMACLVKKGLAKVVAVGKDGPAWTLTALGKNDVETRILPSLRERKE